MRDIGRELLDRIDPVIERIGHRQQRAREIADLVAPRAEIGNGGAALHALAGIVGRVGEGADGLGDVARHQDRGRDHDRDGDQRELQDRQPLLAQDRPDIAALVGEVQHAEHELITLHRHRDGENEIARRVHAHGARRRRLQGLRDLAVKGAVQSLQFLIGRIVLPRRPARQPFIELGHPFRRQPGIGRRQAIGHHLVRRHDDAAVELELALAVEQAHPCIGLRDQPAQQGDGELIVDPDRLRPIRRALRQRRRDDRPLRLQAEDSLVDHPDPAQVQPERAADQHQHGDQIERDDEARQAAPPAMRGGGRGRALVAARAQRPIV